MLIGASLIGPHVDEIIGQLTLAVRARVPVEVLADTVQSFPTFTEGLQQAFSDMADEVRRRRGH
jgi:dihydrolipoamide dehydrogenase